MRCVRTVFIASLLLALSHPASTGEPVVTADQLFTDATIMAVVVPDLGAARDMAAKSRLGQVYSQPEMQEFLKPAFAQIAASYEQIRAKNPLLPKLDDVNAGLLTGEIAAGVYRRQNDKAQPFGLVVTLRPKDVEAFKRLMPPPLQPVLVGGQPVPLGGRPSDPAIVLAGDRVILCTPQADLNSFVKRLQDPAARENGKLAASPAYSVANKKFSAPALLFYSDPALFCSHLVQWNAMRDKNGAAVAQDLFRAAGIADVLTLSASIGFSGHEAVLESYIGFNAPPRQGLFSLFVSNTPVNAEALKIADPAAPYVAAGSFNFAGVIPLLQQIAQAAGPEAGLGLGMVLGMGAQMLQFDLQNDLLANLGADWVTAQTAVDTSAPLSFIPGLATSIPLKNAAKVQECLRKLKDGVKRLPEEMGRIEMKEIEHYGKSIFYLRTPVLAGQAVVVVNDRLLFCTSLNAARRTIEQLEKKENILTDKSFQAAIARVTGKPFDPAALPQGFAYSKDNGTGTGHLIMASLGIVAGGAAVGGAAALPATPNAGNIERNERAALRACDSIGTAQEFYLQNDHDGDGVAEYAQTLKGNQSLLEHKAGAADLMMIEKKLAEAEGNPDGKAQFHGYRFKILTGVGEHVGGNKVSFIVNGNMTGGFAVVAYPAVYGVTGKRTFVYSNEGIAHGRDLGAETATIVTKMTEYNPDATWQPANNEHEFGGDPFKEFLESPSGKAVIEMANAVDLGFWPDESFFLKHRHPLGAFAVWTGDGLFARSELPGPGPSSSANINLITVTGITAVIAAIAVPSLLRSRMAANQTAAAACCKAYAEAQEIYRRTDYDGDGVLEYAQAIKGDNSLIEQKAGAGDLALLDRTFGNAEGEPGVATPKAGYLFKILKGQGARATGGKRSYVVNGNMVLGYALVAYPANYDGTGRDTFIINNNGTIFQSDLGPDTHAIVAEMTEFDPDDRWVPSE